jgi:hypothetical protein
VSSARVHQFLVTLVCKKAGIRATSGIGNGGNMSAVVLSLQNHKEQKALEAAAETYEQDYRALEDLMHEIFGDLTEQKSGATTDAGHETDLAVGAIEDCHK